MTALATVVLSAPELEHDDFLGAILRDDLSRDFGPLNQGLTDRDLVATDHQHFFEGDVVADFSRKLFDTEAVAFHDPILLPARLDDCVHCFASFAPQTASPRLQAGDRT